MPKLAFALLLVIFMAAGCGQKQQNHATTTEKPASLKSDCEFSAYNKIEIAELDVGSCRRISQYFIADKNHVYKQLFDPGSSAYDQYITVKEADPSTFLAVKDFGYFKDNSNLFYDAGQHYRIITGPDFNSVEVLSTHYLKDKDHLYSIMPESSAQTQIIRGFDVKTFQVVQNEQNHEQYFKDTNGVYFTEQIKTSSIPSQIKQADIGSFEVLNYYSLAKDKNYIYYSGKIVNGADSETFEVLGADYFKDKTSVYTTTGGFRRLPGIDGSSFELIYYSADQWLGYSKDKNNVYYQDAVVESADPATFQVKNGKAFDKNYEFQGQFKVVK